MKTFAFLVQCTFLFPVVLCALPAPAQVFGGRLPTRWDKDINPAAPLPQYPRPQMTRNRWQSLNGTWSTALTDCTTNTPPLVFGGHILVPYPYESALSGSQSRGGSIPDRRLWYRKMFFIPAVWRTGGQRVLLHFGAINWDSTVFVNGKKFGEHKGGYDPIDLDITDVLQSGPNELVVSAWNPMPVDVPNGQVMGKQRVHSGGIFYTGATGIWQSVWLEPVPAVHISSLKLVPDVDASVLKVTVSTGGISIPVVVTAMDGGKGVASVKGTAGTELVLPLIAPHLWTPDDPHLYDLKVRLSGKNADSVDGYFAMRKISIGKDKQGVTRILLNNTFVPQIGLLDQGYWPDGIYTAPTDEALSYDIKAAKALGYNLLRKHAKVEPERWYYWADRLGILVWQDMPQAFGELDDPDKAQWVTEWKREITTHFNHPSIIVWTTFNEGWGENTFDVPNIVALTQRLDPTRLVNNASGWTDKGTGELRDTHAYPGPWSETAASQAPRAVVCGEFGGITRRIPDHMWTTDVFGYGTALQNGRQVTQRYQDLMRTAYRLMQDDQHGTSAFVYTQLTDVEQESNGMLTYDRSIIKGDAALIRAANHGQFPSLPPDPDPPFVPTSLDIPQMWQYVTSKPAEGWTQLLFDASAWKTGLAPFGQGVGSPHTPWTDTPGDIWLRRTVTLPAVIPPKVDVVTLHDEDVEVYVNGVLAASATGYTGDYVVLPMSEAARATLKPGQNVLAVHCRQTTGGQVIDVGLARR